MKEKYYLASVTKYPIFALEKKKEKEKVIIEAEEKVTADAKDSYREYKNGDELIFSFVPRKDHRFNAVTDCAERLLFSIQPDN